MIDAIHLHFLDLSLSTCVTNQRDSADLIKPRFSHLQMGMVIAPASQLCRDDEMRELEWGTQHTVNSPKQGSIFMFVFIIIHLERLAAVTVV